MALINRLQAIGNAIREKTGKTNTLTLDEMPNEILSINTGSSGVPFKYGGFNAVKIAEYSNTFTLDETSFVIGSSANTTASTILASKTDYTTQGTKTFGTVTHSPTYAFGDSDVVVVQKIEAIPTHNGSDQKAEAIRTVTTAVSHFTKRKTTDTSANTTRAVTTMSLSMCKYYNTSGAVTRAIASYGFYGTPAAPNFSSSTSASTHVRVPTPTLYYRASSTYEKADNIKLVTDVLWKWSVAVYVVDSNSTIARAMFDDVDDMLINGLSLEATPMTLDLDDENTLVEDGNNG